MKQPHLDRYLRQLVEQGYGQNVSKVADYLIDREIDDLLRSGVLTPISKESLHTQSNIGSVCQQNDDICLHSEKDDNKHSGGEK